VIRMRGIVITRRNILVAGGAGATAAALGGLIAAGSETARSAPSASQDADVLAFILGVERIESGFYAAVARTGRLSGELAEFVAIVGGHEREHVAFLEQALGSAAPKAQPFTADVGALADDPKRFVRTAAALEDAVVAAYNGQAANLRPETLAKAATIVSVEARHAAWIRDIGGLPPAEDTTDEPLTSDGVRDALRRVGLLS
jgi:truncated hemoglobin YjbI